MESVFLACLLFGALFTLVSVALGAVGAAGAQHGLGGGEGADAGVFGAGAHGLHGGHIGPVGPVGHSGGAALPAHGHVAGLDTHGAHGEGVALDHGAPVKAGLLQSLPLLNLSSLVAFLTWFGATGLVLLHFTTWPLAGVVVLAVAAGLAGALLIALFLSRVAAGEQVMDARAYRLPGTLARVTVSIPAAGVGEIVFAKGGRRRSEAARSRTGRPIPRDTEVVILDYRRGTAAVQPWAELLAETNGAPAPARLSEATPVPQVTLASPANETSAPSGV